MNTQTQNDFEFQTESLEKVKQNEEDLSEQNAALKTAVAEKQKILTSRQGAIGELTSTVDLANKYLSLQKLSADGDSPRLVNKPSIEFKTHLKSIAENFVKGHGN